MMKKYRDADIDHWDLLGLAFFSSSLSLIHFSIIVLECVFSK